MNREYGLQPLDALMNEKSICNHDLVAASTKQLTHKVVGKARKGRWITMNARHKVTEAYNAVTGEDLKVKDLFNYY